MPRYKISLHYPNGSTSHETTTSSAIKASVWCAAIFQSDDLREVASRLLVTYGSTVLFDAPPSSIPYDDCEGAITFPEASPRRYQRCNRATVTMPQAIFDEAKKVGNGNVSKGLLELVLENRPELTERCFTTRMRMKAGNGLNK
ncbi:TPA: hypothetical protein I9Y37_001848 [Citrobacter freundii]|nr:hypothetical protein [Citrobacter freundii]HAT3963826.1 hypothetical protein [Citrobacter freundii]